MHSRKISGFWKSTLAYAKTFLYLGTVIPKTPPFWSKTDFQLQILLHFVFQIDEHPDHIFILFSISYGGVHLVSSFG